MAPSRELQAEVVVVAVPAVAERPAVEHAPTFVGDAAGPLAPAASLGDIAADGERGVPLGGRCALRAAAGDPGQVGPIEQLRAEQQQGPEIGLVAV